MSLETIIKIKNNPNYTRYIRENSYWYKILNRNPNAMREFEEKVKEAYGLRRIDRISKTLDTIELVEKLLTTLK